MTSPGHQVTRAARQPVTADNSGYPPETLDLQWSLAFRTLLMLHDSAAADDVQLQRTGDQELALSRLALIRLQHDDGTSIA